MKEYRDCCVKIADLHIKEDWRKSDKNDLCLRCCEYEGVDKDMYNAYFCALMVRYWNLINSNYYQGKGAYPISDCYDWLVDSISGTIKSKSWLDPSSSLYNDPLAPDKSINVRMKSHRQGFYQWSNCQKRSGDFTCNNSLEQISESYGDTLMPRDIESFNDFEYKIMMNNFIKREFKSKNYMGSFVVYGILNGEVFDKVKEGNSVYNKFNKKKLYSYVRHLDDCFYKSFSSDINVSDDDLKEAITVCNDLSRVRIHTLIDSTIASLPKKLGLNRQ